MNFFINESDFSASNWALAVFNPLLNFKVSSDTSNPPDYFRVSAVLGTDSRGKIILKEFYGKSKTEAETKKKAEVLLKI